MRSNETFMESIMDITKFCADKNEVRTYLSRPIQLESCVAATNGHICVFEAGSKANASDGSSVPSSTLSRLSEFYAECISETNWIKPKQATLPEKLDCRSCDGSGRLSRVRCPECDGDCYVSFENEFSDYTIECDTCGGKGTVKASGEPLPVCDECNGEKQVWDDRVHFIVDGICLNPHYYSLLCEMPDLKISIKDRMVYFKSTQFTGILMAMRQ
jgi:hypothetical protein